MLDNQSKKENTTCVILSSKLKSFRDPVGITCDSLGVIVIPQEFDKCLIILNCKLLIISIYVETYNVFNKSHFFGHVTLERIWNAF